MFVRREDARYDPRFDFLVNDPEDKGHDTNFLATVMEQSRLNRIAAIYTALAILLQAEHQARYLSGGFADNHCRIV